MVPSRSLVENTTEHFLSCTSMVDITCSLLSPARMKTDSENPGMASRSRRDKTPVGCIGHHWGLPGLWVNEIELYNLRPLPEGMVEPFCFMRSASWARTVPFIDGTREKAVHGRVGCMQFPSAWAACRRDPAALWSTSNGISRHPQSNAFYFIFNISLT